MQQAPTDRHIALTGAKNFRDFGGYPTRSGGSVKTGLLFRSDRLSNLSADDLAIIEPFAIRTIYDLRSSRERELAPSLWHDNSSTRNLHLPLIAESGNSVLTKAFRKNLPGIDHLMVHQAMVELYRGLVSEAHSTSCLQRIFHSLASAADLPVLIHCSGGKDRTGIVCALILWILGVERQLIEEDYLLSQTLYSDRVDTGSSIPQALDHMQDEKWSTEAIRALFGVDAAYIGSALNYLEESFGNADRYAREGLKLSEQHISQLQQNLLEK